MISRAGIGAGYGTWEAQQRGERPIVPEARKTAVSCLTPKYQEPEAVMVLWNNKSVFRLPGQGEQTNDRCGEWVHPLRCPNTAQTTLDGKEHDSYVATHSCHNPDCPVCYESWASRQAQTTADRLIQGAGLYRKTGYRMGRIDHVVFSPPQDLAKDLHRTSGGAKILRTMAKDMIKKAGASGGVVIYHPFRQNDPREPNFNSDIPAYAWYESPHFHALITGYLMKSNEFYDKTGWAYKKMGQRATIAGTVKYTLTHCGIADGFQAITYFGLFSYNKIVIDKIEKVTEAVKCTACGTELHLYALVENDNGGYDVDWSQDLGVYLHVVVRKTYKLHDDFRFVYNPVTCGYDRVELKT